MKPAYEWPIHFALVFSLLGTDLAHANSEQDALELIANFAERMCEEIPLTGSAQNSELSGQAQAELSSFISYLADIGVEGAISLQNENYQGLIRKDLVRALSDNKKCRLQIWNDLKVKIVGVGNKSNQDHNQTAELVSEESFPKDDEIFRFNRYCSTDAKSGKTFIECGKSFCEIAFDGRKYSERMIFDVKEIDIVLDRRSFGVDFNCKLGNCLEFKNSQNEEYARDYHSINYTSANFNCAELMVDIFK